jgi:hypothetical protein
VDGGDRMRFAYADPPYPGNANKYPEKQEVDHKDLIERLCCDFPDGWALSTGSTNLKYVLSLCPDDVRVMVWTKGMVFFKPNVRIAYSWEPVLVRGGRKWREGSRRDLQNWTVRDWICCNNTFGKGLPGAKPEAFCYWLFEVLGLEPGDELVDLFPGTGILGICFENFKRSYSVQLELK